LSKRTLSEVRLFNQGERSMVKLTAIMGLLFIAGFIIAIPIAIHNFVNKLKERVIKKHG
jgi:hypothetical protein